jgi:hypothetical protein
LLQDGRVRILPPGGRNNRFDRRTTVTDSDTVRDGGDDPTRNWPGSAGSDDPQGGQYNDEGVGRREDTETRDIDIRVQPLTDENSG